MIVNVQLCAAAFQLFVKISELYILLFNKGLRVPNIEYRVSYNAACGMSVCGTVTLTYRCVYFQNNRSVGFIIINVLMEDLQIAKRSTQVLRRRSETR